MIEDIAQCIEKKIIAEFSDCHLEIINESHQHAGPATDSHFKLIIASDNFENLSLVKRHQWIYKILSEELIGPVHALGLHLYTLIEWDKLSLAVPDSPNCSKSG